MGNIMRFEGYEVIVQYLDIEKKNNIEVHMQEKKSPRFCLFCGQDESKVKFTKIAHAVSETIGNKSLFSDYECNNCNSRFGEYFEDSLGKYLLPYKIVSQVYGKKNHLIARDKPKDDNVSYDSYQIQINKNVEVLPEIPTKGLIIENPNANILTMTEDGFKLHIPRQGYNPELVYDAFLKMAYSILPLELYPNYVKRFLLLRELSLKESEVLNEEEKESYKKSLPNCGIISFKPGVNAYNGVNIYMFKKTKKIEKYPEIIFCLEMKNFSFAIPVLADEEGKFVMPPIKLDDGSERCGVVDYHKEEPFFECEFKADKIPLENKSQLEKVLREHSLLK